MKPFDKSVSFAFIVLLAVSSLALLSITPTYAQTTDPASTDFPFYITYNPALAIPEFTIQLADYSYGVPTTTTTSIDPYTGREVVTTQPGYNVWNKTIEFTIPNQPHRSEFVPHQYGVNLYYDIRMKGHFTNDWTELYVFNVDGNGLPIAPNASYTHVLIPQKYPPDAVLDFQVRAINGTVYATLPGTPTAFCYWRYQASGWSSIRTVNLSDASISNTPYINPTITPTVTATPNPTAQPATINPSRIQPEITPNTETPAPANAGNLSLDTTSILVVVVVVLVVVIAALTAALLRKNRIKQAM